MQTNTGFQNETMEIPIVDANDNAPEFQPEEPTVVAVPVVSFMTNLLV